MIQCVRQIVRICTATVTKSCNFAIFGFGYKETVLACLISFDKILIPCCFRRREAHSLHFCYFSQIFLSYRPDRILYFSFQIRSQSFHNVFHCTIRKRIFQARHFQQFKVSLASACLAETVIICPRLFRFFFRSLKELERTDLRQRIINIVERIYENMLLLHPETALLEEFVAIIISPRHIILF